jgi:hypothetical protein
VIFFGLRALFELGDVFQHYKVGCEDTEWDTMLCMFKESEKERWQACISRCYVCCVFPSRLWISFCWVEYVFIFVTFAINEVGEQEVGINVVGFPVGPRRVSGCAQDTSWTPQKCPWKALHLLPTAYSPEQASLSAAGFLPPDFIRKGNLGESIAEYILVMPPQTLLSCNVHVNVLDEPHADLCVMTRWVEALGQYSKWAKQKIRNGK